MKVEEKIKSVLSGDSLANALDFVAWLQANEMVPDANIDGNGWAVGGVVGDSVGYMMADGTQKCPGPWTLWFNESDFGDGDSIADEIKETAWSRISPCGKCHAGWADCGCIDRTVFGKEFKQCCHSPLMFCDPDAKTLEHMKELMLLIKARLPEIKRKRAEQAAAELKKGKEALTKFESTEIKNQPTTVDFRVAHGSQKYEIDLTTMNQRNDVDLRYDNGRMIMCSPGDDSGMVTDKWFSGPVKIELRAKTDGDNIRIFYGFGEVILNWECNRDELRIHDVATSKEYGYPDCGRVPVDEFVDIEWLIARDVMAVKVNGELRHAGVNYPYIEKLKEPNCELGSFVRVAAAWGSTVTVESLRVTAL